MERVVGVEQMAGQSGGGEYHFKMCKSHFASYSIMVYQVYILEKMEIM